MPRLSEMVNSGINQGNAVIETDYFTVEENTQTKFTLKSPVNNPQNLLVFVNGVEKDLSQYTIVGNELTLLNPAVLGNKVKIINFKNLTVADRSPQPVVDTLVGGNIVYELSQSPASTSSIIVSINGNIQPPNSYSLNNTTITFNNVTPPSATIVVIHLVGAVISTSTVLPNSVTLSHLALDSVDSRYSQISNTYSKTEIDNKIDVVVNNAPDMMNTLSEIAASLNNDPNFANNIQAQIDTKSPASHHHNDIYYTKTEVDVFLSSKSSKETHYDQGQILTILGEKANKNDVYTKSQVDTLVLNGGSTPVPISPGNRGLFAGGKTVLNVDFNIEYITINTFGNSVKFGNLQEAKQHAAGSSNGINNNGLIAGGFTTSNVSKIEHVNINTTSNTGDFGNLIAPRSEHTAVSNGTNNRSVFMGGTGSFTSDIEYVTTNTPSNALLFGNLLGAQKQGISGTSNGKQDRGVVGTLIQSAGIFKSEFISIPVLSNSVVFGDLYQGEYIASLSNDTHSRGVFSGGRVGTTALNVMQYINIAVQGNAQAFGTLTIARSELDGVSNGVNERGIFVGGNDGSAHTNTMDYITISVISNAAPFGSLMTKKSGVAAFSNGLL
jgi:hypothetical protein